MWTDLNVWKMLRNTSIRAQILEEGVSGGKYGKQGNGRMRAREWEWRQKSDQIEREEEKRMMREVRTGGKNKK